MILPKPARDYVLAALENTPATVSALLIGLPVQDPIWDTRPHADRFNLREIVAHLADWEPVFYERLHRTIREDHPLLLRPDLDQRAKERGYRQADPAECLVRFRAERVALADWLRSLPDDSWTRLAHLERIGDLSLEGLISLMLGHDSYHLRQIAEGRSTA